MATRDRAEPVQGWTVADPNWRDEGVRLDWHLGRTRSEAWAAFFAARGTPERNTPRERARLRRRGYRPVRVILHEIGDGDCNA